MSAPQKAGSPVFQGCYDSQRFPFVRGVVALCGVGLLAHASYQAHFTFFVFLRQGGAEARMACIRVDVEKFPNVSMGECGGLRELLDYRFGGFLLRVATRLFDVFSEKGGDWRKYVCIVGHELLIKGGVPVKLRMSATSSGIGQFTNCCIFSG